ncbi:MAG TPA: peptide chain release factor N(5)-glutamine methyltransferase [Bryobacteraceae bacterium]|jgi:release factor glutamine methyltransferase|nr:peptide chain release factor N(5)-glutamine methyltransferase [Bryobacteraceae bacterium]
MTIRTALAQGSQLLGRDGVAEPRLTAEVLLGHATHRDRAWFYAHPEQELREVEWIHYGRYLDERLRGKPTQYITKRQEFFGREFIVSRDVLIPRPETELLVETVLKLKPAPGRLIDIGTGSGIIAITLALELDRPVIATDLSFEACTVAQSNARKLGANVRFLEADLLRPFADNSTDLIVSNPPYVPLSDRTSLQREVRDWEPSLALFGGPSGMAVYQRLLPEAMRVLKPGGILALEIGFSQSEAVSALASDWHNLQLFSDLAGIPRVLICES